ncbi:serine/threonine-protein kinase [Sphaerisporangium sp. TRM90804]|uniref:serine/threonine-protein kinase n=1 Tax=Sphaerisporangium sp. TRM90804 TaxID=3031113 RepID=UPI002446CAAA|nr:serine/threonine-protein kinase [Sphaerisporangium sp. TRM90804]MDH2425615.1 protein kinase [Sphaerisporangium sp. TRM90804]
MFPCVTAHSPRVLVGRYRLTSSLGKGGMGTVWRAVDELLQQEVAVKEVRLPPDLDDATRAELFERTLREARAAARLRAHPSIVTVHDVVDDGRPWIIMELVQGRSLDQMIREHGPLPPRQVADIGIRLLDALAAAHAAGILHRDVKPANILITGEGRVVLTDFGIATLAGEAALTQTGLVSGSPGFMAPERLKGEDDRPESDLWSLGATLYAAVEGRSPYARERQTAVLAAVLLDLPHPMMLAGPLAPVLAGLLEKDPARRHSAGQAAAQLRSITAHGPSNAGAPRMAPPPHGNPPLAAPPVHGALPAQPARPARKKPVVLGAVLALTVALVTGAVFATRDVWQGALAAPRKSGDGTTRSVTAAPSESGTGVPSPTEVREAAYTKDPEACELVNLRQAGQFLTGPAKQRFMTKGMCMWQREDIGAFFHVNVIRSPTTENARMVFASLRENMQEEPRRNPGTTLRKGPDVGDEAFSYAKGEVIADIRIHRTQVLFRQDNVNVIVYFTLRSPGYRKADLVAALVEKGLAAYR